MLSMKTSFISLGSGVEICLFPINVLIVFDNLPQVLR